MTTASLTELSPRQRRRLARLAKAYRGVHVHGRDDRGLLHFATRPSFNRSGRYVPPRWGAVDSGGRLDWVD